MEPSDDHADVAVIPWPGDRDRVEELERGGKPCLLLIARDDPPPPPWGLLVDWLRMPIDDVELDVRTTTLRRPRRARAAPIRLDDQDVLRRGDAWVALPAGEALVFRALLEHIGEVVGYDEFVPAAYRETLRHTVWRLRDRITVLQLRIHGVRRRGYLLECPTPDMSPVCRGGRR